MPKPKKPQSPQAIQMTHRALHRALAYHMTNAQRFDDLAAEERRRATMRQRGIREAYQELTEAMEKLR